MTDVYVTDGEIPLYEEERAECLGYQLRWQSPIWDAGPQSVAILSRRGSTTGIDSGLEECSKEYLRIKRHVFHPLIAFCPFCGCIETMATGPTSKDRLFRRWWFPVRQKRE